MFSSDMKELMI